jgi:hypothetical protein
MTLKGLVDTTPYPSGHSDIVALAVAEHETTILNLLTRANHQTRAALHYQTALNKELGRPADFQAESTASRIKSVAEPLVQAMLFCGEAPLTAPITGTSGFSAQFAARGPRDAKGRSLYDLDLKTRLFKNPLSYLIYSETFDGLPAPAKEYVYRRLNEILSGKDASPEFNHLTATDRETIRDILLATKPDFAAFASRQ